MPHRLRLPQCLLLPGPSPRACAQCLSLQSLQKPYQIRYCQLLYKFSQLHAEGGTIAQQVMGFCHPQRAHAWEAHFWAVTMPLSKHQARTEMKDKSCVQGKMLVGGELAEPEGKLTKAQKKNLKRLEKKVAARATTDASVASSEV